MINKAKYEDKCECGAVLNYRTTPFQSVEVRVCPQCGKHHNVDTQSIDWGKLKGENHD